MNPFIRPQKPLVIAHRGASLAAPENTLPAYQKAIEAGADMLEMDVNISIDGQLVMIHDPTLDRTTNGTGLVHEWTLDNLLHLDAGMDFKPRIKDVRIPTTRETLQLVRDAKIQACFEIKGSDDQHAILIAEKLMELFHEFEAFEWACISSYFPLASAAAKRIAPNLVVTRERLPDDSPFDLQDALQQAAELDSPVLLSDFRTIQKADVDALHVAGVAVWAWNPFEPGDITQMIAWGVDGIMGDNPGVARELVDLIPGNNTLPG